ncbi:MAG: leucine-rich repeat protein [Abditibacteriota bacterium]|nr:leucine-rich repeat protein [Abditibacteriota bacterium]
MKKYICLFLLFLLCYCVLAREEDPCQTEGNRLLYYTLNEKVTNLYERRDIMTFCENSFCNKKCETLILPIYALRFEKYSLCNNSKLKELTLSPYTQFVEECAFAGNSFEEFKMSPLEFKDYKEMNNYYLGLCISLGLIRKDTTLLDPYEYNPSVPTLVSILPRRLYNLVSFKYKVENGVLYTYSGLSLVAYPAMKKLEEFTVPNSVMNIYDGAFKNCPNLKTVYIPGTVLNIGDRAFEDNPNLVLQVHKNSEAYKYCLNHKLKYSFVL